MSYRHGVSVGRTQAACRLSVCHEPDAGDVELRDGFVGFGNTAPRGQLLVHGLCTGGASVLGRPRDLQCAH